MPWYIVLRPFLGDNVQRSRGRAVATTDWVHPERLVTPRYIRPATAQELVQHPDILAAQQAMAPVLASADTSAVAVLDTEEPALPEEQATEADPLRGEAPMPEHVVGLEPEPERPKYDFRPRRRGGNR